MRNKKLNIRISKQEHTAIARRAKDCGLSISEYVRRCSLNETKRPVIYTDIELLQSIYRDLRRTGGNINQIARYLNTYSNNVGLSDEQLEMTLATNAKASSELADFIAAIKASV